MKNDWRKRLKLWFCDAKKLCVGAVLMAVITLRSLSDCRFLSPFFCWFRAFSISEVFSAGRLTFALVDFMDAENVLWAARAQLVLSSKIWINCLFMSNVPFGIEETVFLYKEGLYDYNLIIFWNKKVELRHIIYKNIKKTTLKPSWSKHIFFFQRLCCIR